MNSETPKDWEGQKKNPTSAHGPHTDAAADLARFRPQALGTAAFAGSGVSWALLGQSSPAPAFSPAAAALSRPQGEKEGRCGALCSDPGDLSLLQGPRPRLHPDLKELAPSQGPPGGKNTPSFSVLTSEEGGRSKAISGVFLGWGRPQQPLWPGLGHGQQGHPAPCRGLQAARQCQTQTVHPILENRDLLGHREWALSVPSGSDHAKEAGDKHNRPGKSHFRAAGHCPASSRNLVDRPVLARHHPQATALAAGLRGHTQRLSLQDKARAEAAKGHWEWGARDTFDCQATGQ